MFHETLRPDSSTSLFHLTFLFVVAFSVAWRHDTGGGGGGGPAAPHLTKSKKNFFFYFSVPFYFFISLFSVIFPATRVFYFFFPNNRGNRKVRCWRLEYYISSFSFFFMFRCSQSASFNCFQASANFEHFPIIFTRDSHSKRLGSNQFSHLFQFWENEPCWESCARSNCVIILWKLIEHLCEFAIFQKIRIQNHSDQINFRIFFSILEKRTLLRKLHSF